MATADNSAVVQNPLGLAIDQSNSLAFFVDDGISFGNALIKRVVQELTREFRNIRTFVTLSPMPRFRDSRLLFAERFIEGPEFTAFVMGNWRDPGSVRCLPPAERVFNASIPDGEKFLSYERYWGVYRDETPPPDGGPFYGYAACEARLAPMLMEISRGAYIAVHGMGYARVDLRMDRATGELFVLEVNANCGLSQDDQTSTGCILRLAGMSLADLLKEILGALL